MDEQGEVVFGVLGLSVSCIVVLLLLALIFGQ